MKRSDLLSSRSHLPCIRQRRVHQWWRIIRKPGITEQTFYRWKKKYGKLMPSQLRKLKQLEEENSRLRRLVANLSLDKEMLQEAMALST